jgi:hypothetical protein
MTYFSIVDVHILAVYLNFVEELGAVHEVIFCDKERQPVDGCDIEDIGYSLIVFIVMGSYLSDFFIEIRHI